MYLLYLYRVFYSGRGSFRSLTYGQADGAFTCLNIKKYFTKLGFKVMDNDRDKERTLRRRPQESIKTLREALCTLASGFAFVPVLYLGRYYTLL